MSQQSATTDQPNGAKDAATGEWYLQLTDRVVGPMSSEKLLQLVKEKKVQSEQLVRHVSSNDWLPLSQVLQRKPREKSGDVSEVPARQPNAAPEAKPAEGKAAPPPLRNRAAVPPPTQAATPFYCEIFDQLIGPCSADDLKALATTGRLKPNDKVRVGDGPWKLASKVKGLEFIAAPAEPVETPAPKVSKKPKDSLSVSILDQAPESAGESSNAKALVPRQNAAVQQAATAHSNWPAAAQNPIAAQAPVAAYPDPNAYQANPYGYPPGAYPPGYPPYMMPGMVPGMMPGMGMPGYGHVPMGVEPVRRKKKKKKRRPEPPPQGIDLDALMAPGKAHVDPAKESAPNSTAKLPDPETTGVKVHPPAASTKAATAPDNSVRNLAQAAITKSYQLSQPTHQYQSSNSNEDRAELIKKVGLGVGAAVILIAVGWGVMTVVPKGPFGRPGGQSFIEAQQILYKLDSMEDLSDHGGWETLRSQHEVTMTKIRTDLDYAGSKNPELGQELGLCHGESFNAVITAKTPKERGQAIAEFKTHVIKARQLYDKR